MTIFQDFFFNPEEFQERYKLQRKRKIELSPIINRTLKNIDITIFQDFDSYFFEFNLEVKK